MTETTSDTARILQDLVRIPSHERESEAVEYLARRFDSLGVTYTVREIMPGGRESITAEWGQGAKSLILNSHLDTVSPGDPDKWSSPPCGAVISGGRMYGRGTADAKGPLAAMIVAFESLVRDGTPLDGKLILMAVGLEETLGAGTAQQVREGVTADAAVVGEPTDLKVHISHKGVLRLDVTTLGKAAHSSEPWEGKNAILGMRPVLGALEGLSEKISQRQDALLGRASLAVTMISGGTARNVIPQSCTISIDRRFLPEESARDVRSEINKALKPLAETAHEIEIHLHDVSLAEAASIPPGSGIAETALRSRNEIIGQSSKLEGFTACCDMWHLTNQGRIPAVIFGPGKLSQAHKTDEWIDMQDLDRAAAVYRRIALNWLGSQS